MAYFDRYNKAINDYAQWMTDLHASLNEVERNILQNDKSDVVIEKIVSIFIATAFVSIGSFFMGIVGFAAAGVFGGIALFVIGWLLSTAVNKNIFGSERTVEEINEHEKTVLSEKNSLTEYFRPVAKKLKIQRVRKEVAFTNYHHIQGLLSHFHQLLVTNNCKNLAYKYRRRHSESIQQSTRLINKFNNIYAPTKSTRK